MATGEDHELHTRKCKSLWIRRKRQDAGVRQFMLSIGVTTTENHQSGKAIYFQNHDIIGETIHQLKRK